MIRKLKGMFRAILMLDDTPHSIALGAAIGLFIAWTPTVGIHMILVVALALFLRANKVAGLIAVYVSNPFTILPMYWFEYRLGAIVLNEKVTYEEMQVVLNHHGWKEWWAAFWKLCIDLAGPMWLGGLVLALVHAIPAYYLTRWAVLRFRRRHPEVSPAANSAPNPQSSPETTHHPPLTTHSSSV